MTPRLPPPSASSHVNDNDPALTNTTNETTSSELPQQQQQQQQQQQLATSYNNSHNNILAPLHSSSGALMGSSDFGNPLLMGGGYGGMMGGGYGGMMGGMGGYGGMMGGIGPLSQVHSLLMNVQSIVFSVGQLSQMIQLHADTLQSLMEKIQDFVQEAVRAYSQSSNNSRLLSPQQDEERRKKLRTIRWALVTAVSFAVYKFTRYLLFGRRRRQHLLTSSNPSSYPPLHHSYHSYGNGYGNAYPAYHGGLGSGGGMY